MHSHINIVKVHAVHVITSQMPSSNDIMETVFIRFNFKKQFFFLFIVTDRYYIRLCVRSVFSFVPDAHEQNMMAS